MCICCIHKAHFWAGPLGCSEALGCVLKIPTSQFEDKPFLPNSVSSIPLACVLHSEIVLIYVFFLILRKQIHENHVANHVTLPVCCIWKRVGHIIIYSTKIRCRQEWCSPYPLWRLQHLVAPVHCHRVLLLGICVRGKKTRLRCIAVPMTLNSRNLSTNLRNRRVPCSLPRCYSTMLLASFAFLRLCRMIFSYINHIFSISCAAVLLFCSKCFNRTGTCSFTRIQLELHSTPTGHPPVLQWCNHKDGPPEPRQGPIVGFCCLHLGPGSGYAISRQKTARCWQQGPLPQGSQCGMSNVQVLRDVAGMKDGSLRKKLQ